MTEKQIWLNANKKARKTAKWAITLTKVRITKQISRTKWHLLTFVGPNGGESVGIVDLLAIRKNHRPVDEAFNRGDLFDVVLIQVKGGAALLPSVSDIRRLRQVAAYYNAKAVLLSQWKRGRQVEFSILNDAYTDDLPKNDAWLPLNSLHKIFN